MIREGIYGLLAEFDTPGALVHAAERAHAEGYRKMDTYTPYPLEEASEAIGFKRNYVSLITLIGGILGGLGGYSLQYWVSTIAYPINVGGKPFHSWPAFVPVTFECTVLGAALSATIGMLVMNGLPMPYHPVFNSPNFVSASKEKFFLCLESADPKFDLSKSRKFLEQLGPRIVTEVPN
jgi:Alternative complex III, ActD subunit